MKAKNLPNHLVATFPGYLSNPNSIQEGENTFYLALDPQPDPDAIYMDSTNSNNALNMGATGVAINGVVFYNPFDSGTTEAVDII